MLCTVLLNTFLTKKNIVEDKLLYRPANQHINPLVQQYVSCLNPMAKTTGKKNPLVSTWCFLLCVVCAGQSMVYAVSGSVVTHHDAGSAV